MSKRSNKRRIKAAEAAALLEANPKFKVSASSMVAKTEPLFELKVQEAPKVWYSNRAWQKMKQAISMCPDEVGWLGTVDTVEGGYLVTDIHVPEQIVTGTETDISAESLANLAEELDYPENLFYWGHSHVNMGVSPSGQDEQQTAEYLEHNDVFIRGIYNKKGDSKVDVFDMVEGMLYQKVANGVKIEALPDNEMTEFKAKVSANVKKFVYKPPNRTHNNGYQGGGSRQESNFQRGQSGGVPDKSVSVIGYNNPFIKMEAK